MTVSRKIFINNLKENNCYLGVSVTTKEVLNVNEACSFLQIGKATLYRHTKAGEIPSFKIGKALRFHKESLEEWIKRKVEENTAQKR